jgi:hypothetical protein
VGRWTALVTWGVVVVAAFALGPPQRPDTGDLVRDLLTGNFAPYPPWLVAHFQWMGLWPALVGLALRGDWRARFPAWPFVLASFFLGCFALLPWFVLRPQAPRTPPPAAGWLARWELPLVFGIMGLGWGVWAAATGSVGDWVTAAGTDGFTWAMTWDFAAFWVLSVAECRRRSPQWAWSLVPLVGFAGVLAVEARRGQVR